MRTALALIMISVTFFALTDRAIADEAEDLNLFHAASLLYEDGNFEEAARAYEQLTRLGYHDSTLYYNLANSYYRADDHGRAVLNYLRASRLAPFDSDIRVNLALALADVGTTDSEKSPVPVLAQFADWVPWVSPNVAVSSALLLWIVLSSMLIAVVWNRRFRNSSAVRLTAAVATLGIVLLGVLAIGQDVSVDHWSRVAVVTAMSTDVLDAPRSTSTVRVSLESGREVTLVAARGGWAQVRLPRTQLEGWVPRPHVETILPTSH